MEGDFVGEQILNDEFDYPLTATCIEESFTCGFTREGFRKADSRLPEHRTSGDQQPVDVYSSG